MEYLWLQSVFLQVVIVNNRLSKSLIINTGASQGCVLSPLSHFTQTDICKLKHKMFKFADDATLVGDLYILRHSLKKCGFIPRDTLKWYVYSVIHHSWVWQ